MKTTRISSHLTGIAATLRRVACVASLALGTGELAPTARASLLVSEPFAYTAGSNLSGATGGTGFDSGSSWSTFIVSANSTGFFQIQPAGVVSGVILNDGVTPNPFTATYANLPSSGNYAGMNNGGAGSTEYAAGVADHLYMWRKLHPTVTATFADGNTTWLSFSSGWGYNGATRAPSFAIGAGIMTGPFRGDNTTPGTGNTSSEAIVVGGITSSPDGNVSATVDGVATTFGGTAFYRAQYFSTSGARSYQTGPTGTVGGAALSSTIGSGPLAGDNGRWVMGGKSTSTYAIPYGYSDANCPATTKPMGDNPSHVNITVAKIEWGAGTGGTDKISFYVYHDKDALTEASFNAGAKTWETPSVSAKSTFNYLSVGGGRYFIDEIRVATTFAEATGSTAYAEAIKALNPIGYWKLNETIAAYSDPAADAMSSNNGGYANFSGRTPVTGALVGSADQAQNFPNTSEQQVVIPWSATLNPATPETSAFTVEAWVKSANNTSGTHNIVTSMRQPGQFGTDASSANDRSGWAMREASGDFQFLVGAQNAAPSYWVLLVSGAVTTSWQHWAVTYDGTPGGYKIYLNGVLQTYTVHQNSSTGTAGSATDAVMRQNTDCPQIIGARAFAGWAFKGDIDEVTIYGSALAGATLLSHYDNGIAATPSPTYDVLVKASSPLAYYRLNEASSTPRVALNSGSLATAANGAYSANGVISSTGPPNPPNTGMGIYNTACYFNGAGDVNCGNNVGFDVSTLSIAAWVKSDGIQAYMNILAKGGTLWRLHCNGTSNTLSWTVPGGGVDGSKPVADGNWHFVVATTDSSGSALYVDGVPDGTGGGFNGATNTDPVRIGSQDGYQWKGSLDEVALFSSKLTAGQVAALYTVAAPPISGLYWAPVSGGGGTGTWNAAATLWSQTAGTQGTLAQGTNGALKFATAGGTVTIDGTVTAAKGLSFSAGSYSLVAGTSTPNLSLGGASATANTVTVDSGLTAAISAPLTGSTGMTKAGSGSLVLSAANTYSGDTSLSDGTLKLTAGSLGNTAIMVRGTAILAVQPGRSRTLSAGNTGTAATGATLDLGSGTTFDMTDGAINTFQLVQEGSYGGTALTLADGVTLKFDLGNSSADLLAVTKSANATGTVNVTIDVSSATFLTAGTYKIITAAADSSLTGGTWQFTGGGTILAVTVGGIPYNLILNVSDTAGVSVTVVSSITTTTALSTSGSPSTYGNAVTFTAQVSPIPSGGTVQFYVDSVATGGAANVNTGTGRAQFPISDLATGSHTITATYSGYLIYSPSTSGPVTQVVGPRLLTITGPAVDSKPYDGSNIATITGTLSGVIGLDDVFLVGTGRFPSPNAGTSLTVTPDCTLAGGQSGNYTLTQPTTGMTGTITKAELTVTADHKVRLTNVPNPELTYTLVGFQNGENAGSANVTGAPGLTTNAVQASPPATYTITCTVGNLAAPNYLFPTAVNGTLTITTDLTWWAGTGTWDIGVSSNWNAGSTTYVNGFAVLFDDSAVGSGSCSVTLNTTVTPPSVTVNNPTRNYSFNVSSGSGISGATGLVKQGNAQLTLAGAHGYAGGTTVTGGTLNPHGNNNALGSGSVSLNSGTALKVTDPGGAQRNLPNAFVLNSGTVTLQTGYGGGGTDVQFDGLLSGAGGLDLIGFGDNFNERRLELPNANTFQGGLIYRNSSAVRVRIGNPLALGTGALRFEQSTSSMGGSDLLGGLEATISLSAAPGVANPIEIVSGRYFRTYLENDLLLSGPITGSGILLKDGYSTLKISSSANTCTGDIRVKAGTLELTDTGRMKFALANAGVSNKITRTGTNTVTVNLNGAFVIDTSAVTNTTGTWTLVDVAVLTETFHPTSFSVVDFTPNIDGVTWTKSEPGKLWTFSETTGMLTLTAVTSVPASFSNLSVSQTITAGTASVTLSGTVSGSGPVYPLAGGTVTVTINGASQNATISGAAGGFSIAYPTAALLVSGSPYTITYGYAGNGSTLNPAPDNSSTTLTVQTTFTSWINGLDWLGFTSPNLSATGDPDGDGLDNQTEFALNSDPRTGNASGKVRSRIETVGGNQVLVITLPVRNTPAAPTFTGTLSKTADVSQVRYTIEGSNGLSHFDQTVNVLEPASELAMPVLDSGWSYRSFYLDGAIPARGAKGFLRVVITGPVP
ncbi:MAG: LamG-like jellyroll fold domain-containing protein [Verrucomicrobiota bacterium]